MEPVGLSALSGGEAGVSGGGGDALAPSSCGRLLFASGEVAIGSEVEIGGAGVTDEACGISDETRLFVSDWGL